MGACESIEKSFRELLATTPYGKITVSAICDGAGVSRKSFYANFADKEAIVSYVFRRDVVQPLKSLNGAIPLSEAAKLETLFHENIYRAIQRDGEFYYRLIGPMRGHDDTFLRVATNAIYDFNMELLPQLGFCASDWQRDYVAYFFASSQAMLVQKWVSERMVVSVEDLARLYIKMTFSFWKNL